MKTTKSKTPMKTMGLLLGMGLLIGGLVSVPAMADGGRADGVSKAERKQMRQQRRANLKAKRAAMFRTELGLSDAKASQIEAKLDSLRQQQKAMRKAQRTLMKKLQALVAADSNDDAAYTSTLKALELNRSQMQATKKVRADFMRQALTPKQQATLLVKKRSMKKARRGQRGKRGMTRHGGGPAGF